MGWKSGRAAAWAAAGVLALLAGCGGGGGGGGSPSPTPTPDPTPTGTGFVPAAGVLGATLHEQASLLRPMKDGARWLYRYQDFTGASPAQVEVKQTAGAAGVIRELTGQEADSALDLSVDAQGNVRFSASLQLSPTATPLKVDGIELRSPVRVNDLIVVLDRRIDQSGIDADRDGKIDPVDVAMWRVVVGNEAVTLPHRSEPLMAVRVDTTTVVRIVPTSGAAAQTSTQKLSSWYAPGLGLVREAEAGTAGRPLDSDQTLLGFDGVDRGYGYTVTDTGLNWFMGRMPISSVLKLPAGVLLGVEGGLRLVDNFGRPKAMHLFDKGSLLVQTGSQAWVLGATPLGNDRTRYDLYRLDANGKPDATAYASFDPLDQVPLSIYIDRPRFAMSQGSPVFWVYWHDNRSPGLTQDTAFVRRHNGSTWVGEPIQVPLGSAFADWPAALALPDALLLTWVDRGSVQRTVRIGIDGSVSPQQLVNLAPSGALDAGSWSLFADGSGQWAFWWGPTAGADNRPHGARLDANGRLAGTGTDAASLRAALLPSFQDLAGPLDPAQLGGFNGNWVYADVRFEPLYPDQTTPRNHLVARQIKPGGGAPSASMTTAATYHIPDVTMVGPPIVFDSHTLLLTGNGTVMAPVVIWHR